MHCRRSVYYACQTIFDHVFRTTSACKGTKAVVNVRLRSFKENWSVFEVVKQIPSIKYGIHPSLLRIQKLDGELHYLSHRYCQKAVAIHPYIYTKTHPSFTSYSYIKSIGLKLWNPTTIAGLTWHAKFQREIRSGMLSSVTQVLEKAVAIPP